MDVETSSSNVDILVSILNQSDLFSMSMPFGKNKCRREAACCSADLFYNSELTGLSTEWMLASLRQAQKASQTPRETYRSHHECFNRVLHLKDGQVSNWRESPKLVSDASTQSGLRVCPLATNHSSVDTTSIRVRRHSRSWQYYYLCLHTWRESLLCQRRWLNLL